MTGLCRRPPKKSCPISVTSRPTCPTRFVRQAVAGLGITHVVYAARASHRLYKDMKPYEKVAIEEVGPNLDMLRNIVLACEGPALRHVHALAGTKWYGIHIAPPVRTPLLESDPSHMPPNFYVDQLKFLQEGPSRGWSWSTSRPSSISGGHAPIGPDLMSALGVYAAICKHYGLNFDFPGRPGCFTTIQEHTDARQLAAGIFWMCTSPEAQNQTFNITNGDLFRWKNVWPRLAAHFGLPMGDVRHFSLVQWMAGKGPVWDEIVRTQGLQPNPIESVASWAYTDFVLARDFDVISSMTKIRTAGFHRTVDTEEMMLEHLTHYRTKKICHEPHCQPTGTPCATIVGAGIAMASLRARNHPGLCNENRLVKSRSMIKRSPRYVMAPNSRTTPRLSKKTRLISGYRQIGGAR